MLDIITGKFRASHFCRILDKFSPRANPIRIIDDPVSQCPDKCSSTVYLCFFLCFNNGWELVNNATTPSLLALGAHTTRGSS